MIAPVYRMQSVPPAIETAMGNVWRNMAYREGHRPRHNEARMGVKPEIQRKIIRIVAKHGKAWSGLICAELGECKFTVGNYLLRMEGAGLLTRRKPVQNDKSRYAQWIYELPKGEGE